MTSRVRLQIVLLDVERWERQTGMRVEGVLRVPPCEFDSLRDWVTGVVLRDELLEASLDEALGPHPADP